ncbi:MAG: orotidine-5'-phosphate decarboxylase [Planctomycetes bacterium]|nr:orotidine-5'-phosphate decarboxylase [Planctomycetota bacterium]
MVTSYHRRLDQACRERNSRLCVGIDPRLAMLPAEIRPGPGASLNEQARAYLTFAEAVLEAIEPHAAVVKPQSAFFEQLGHVGVQVFEEICLAAQDRGLLVIGDLKRGDIGSTAEAYAEAAFRDVGGRPLLDAVTVNPYLGSDGIRPFLETALERGGGVYVLCKTSNPSSTELQDLRIDGRLVHEHMADLIRDWGEGYPGTIGAVVGATHPDALGRLRTRLAGVELLIPGVGAQGAGMQDAAAGFDQQGAGALVNSSRGITFPWTTGTEAPPDWRDRIRTAAREARDDLRSALSER